MMDASIAKARKNGGQFKEYLAEPLQNHSINSQYADEELESNYGYFSGYKPKNINDQINILRKFFPDIGSADGKLTERRLPSNAEGWFAIPRWEKIASTYGEAVQRVLDLNGASCNHRCRQFDAQYLHQFQKSAEAFQKIGDEQKDHDILIIPAQLGVRHRGRSVRRAREVMNVNEFGLGSFAIGVMILTHPERLQHYKDLRIDCAGDEFSPDSYYGSNDVPYFTCSIDGRANFNAYYFSFVSNRFGSASAFLLQ
jgi:hypothetical protein